MITIQLRYNMQVFVPVPIFKLNHLDEDSFIACIGHEGVERTILTSPQQILLNHLELPDIQPEETQVSKRSFHVRGFYGPCDRRWLVIPVEVPGGYRWAQYFSKLISLVV